MKVLKSFDNGRISVEVRQIESTEEIIETRELTTTDLLNMNNIVDNNSKDPNIFNRIVQNELDSSDYTKKVGMFTINVKRNY